MGQSSSKAFAHHEHANPDCKRGTDRSKDFRPSDAEILAVQLEKQHVEIEMLKKETAELVAKAKESTQSGAHPEDLSKDVSDEEDSWTPLLGNPCTPSKPGTTRGRASGTKSVIDPAKRRCPSRSPSVSCERTAQKRRRCIHPPATPGYDVIPYKNGSIPPAGQKPKHSDYEEWFRELISAASRLYAVKVVTLMAFPTAELQITWAKDAWAAVCDEHGGKCYPEDEIHRILSLIRSKGADVRGDLKDRLRPLVLDNFKIIKNPGVKGARANRKLYLELVEGSPPRYAYADWTPETPSGFGEHNMFAVALCEQFFLHPEDVVAAHQTRFNPISHATLALLFTIVRFHLDSYKTGYHNASVPFSKVNYAKHYMKHLQWVQHWASVDPDETREVRKDMFQAVIRLNKTMSSGDCAARFSQDAEDHVRAELAERRRARERERRQDEAGQRGRKRGAAGARE